MAKHILQLASSYSREAGRQAGRQASRQEEVYLAADMAIHNERMVIDTQREREREREIRRGGIEGGSSISLLLSPYTYVHVYILMTMAHTLQKRKVPPHSL